MSFSIRVRLDTLDTKIQKAANSFTALFVLQRKMLLSGREKWLKRGSEGIVECDLLNCKIALIVKACGIKNN